MGGICPIFVHTKSLPPPTPPVPPLNNQPTTQRPLKVAQTFQPIQPMKQSGKPQRKNTLNDSVNSNGTTRGQKFPKNISTNFGSQLMERKTSSLLFQGCIFQSSSIILKNSKDLELQSKEPNQNCYTLIENVFLVKKSMDCIKVASPHSESKLNCPLNSISSTYYLTQGAPLDSIKEVSTGKIIQATESPILTKVKLFCRNCEKNKNKNRRIVKMTFSTSLIQANQIQCDQCHKKGNWTLISIQSNFPVWGNGHKILSNQPIQAAPNTIRIMGCISCLRYTESEQLPCGCFMCKSCFADNQNKQCQFCECLA